MTEALEARCSQPDVSSRTVLSNSGWNERGSQEDVRRTEEIPNTDTKATGIERVKKTARPEYEKYHLHTFVRSPNDKNWRGDLRQVIHIQTYTIFKQI